MKQLRAPILVVVCGLFVGVPYSGDQCSATTLVYLSGKGLGEGAVPVAPQETLEFLPSGGSFHIWVQPDALFTGISLDVDNAGTAIRFTDSTVHNPVVGSDTRWLPSFIRDGTVSNSEVSRIEGGALAPLVGFGTGIGPATSVLDPLYETLAGFLFATIDFEVDVPAGSDSVTLSIGHNLFSDTTGLYTGSIFLGSADGPVLNSSGATGSVVDLNLIPDTSQTSDFDGNGLIDGEDFLTLQTNFGIMSGATLSQGDGTGDGKVDADDLALWESQYGTVPPFSALSLTVPEPTGCLLSLLGTALCIRRRLHRS